MHKQKIIMSALGVSYVNPQVELQEDLKKATKGLCVLHLYPLVAVL